MSRVRYFGNHAQGAVRIGDISKVVDGKTLTIGSKVYEFDNDAAVTEGNVLVDIKGTEALQITELIAKVNANKPSVPVTASVDPVDTKTMRLVADAPGDAGNIALSNDVADASFAVSAATLLGGENAGTQTVARGKYAVTAVDVSSTSIAIETGLVSPRFATIESYTSIGAKKTSTGLLTVSGTKLLVDFTGGTDHAAGDLIVWSAWE